MKEFEKKHKEAFCNLRFAREMQVQSGIEPSNPSIGQLIRYASSPVQSPSAVMEELIRANHRVFRLYLLALSIFSIGVSERAAAASDGFIRTRYVGPVRVEVVSSKGQDWLIISSDESSLENVSWIEARSESGAGVRVDLGRPVNGVFQLRLDRSSSQLTTFCDYFSSPSTFLAIG